MEVQKEAQKMLKSKGRCLPTCDMVKVLDLFKHGSTAQTFLNIEDSDLRMMWLLRLAKEQPDRESTDAGRQQLAQKMVEREPLLTDEGKSVTFSVVTDPKRANDVIHIEGKERAIWMKMELAYHYGGDLRNVLKQERSWRC